MPLKGWGAALAVGVFLLVSPVATGAAGLTPQQLHSAYDLPSTSPVAQTIAVVVAYDAPTAAADLQTFTKRFAIAACSTAGGCFRKVNQRGEPGSLPGADPTGGSWVSEAVLGTQTARGMCQNCRILLVEADSDGRGDLAAAVATAVRLGATEVATAFLQADEGGDRAAYHHPGVAITAAAGDSGFFDGAFYPAALPDVVAVGGTRLSLKPGGAYGSETVWNDAARQVSTSGCTIFTPAPAWQVAEAASVGCGAQRSVADIAAVASPGAQVYTSTPVLGLDGWIVAGGTSFASPLIAGVFALAGGVPKGVSAPAMLYGGFRAHAGGLHDITTGSNGSCGTRQCTARPGYDGPTGIGTPRGLDAFGAHVAAGARISGVRLSRSVVGPARSSKLSFTLSRAATVRLTIDQRLPGRISAGSAPCRPATGRHGTPCAYYLTRAARTVSGTRKTNRVTIARTFAGHVLKPGTYRLSLAVAHGQTIRRTFTVSPR